MRPPSQQSQFEAAKASGDGRQGARDLAQTLARAILKDQAGRIGELARAGANLNAPDERGRSPAMVAIQEGAPGALAALLEGGADKNALLMGWTLAMMCVDKGDLSCLKALSKAGLDNAQAMTRGHGAWSALMMAAEKGWLAGVQELLAAGADPNAANDEGWTAAHWAAWRDQGECFEALLESGADPQRKAPDGQTPAMFASRLGSPGACRDMLERWQERQALRQAARPAPSMPKRGL